MTPGVRAFRTSAADAEFSRMLPGGPSCRMCLPRFTFDMIVSLL
jgi:hypothetical protein